MRTAFKVISIILLVFYGIIAVMAILSIAGISALTEGKTGVEAGLGGLAILSILLALIPTVIAIFMAIYGIKGNYNLCFKLSAILMVLNIVSFISSNNKGSAVIGLVFSIAYCFMAKKLDDGAF